MLLEWRCAGCGTADLRHGRTQILDFVAMPLVRRLE